MISINLKIVISHTWKTKKTGNETTRQAINENLHVITVLQWMLLQNIQISKTPLPNVSNRAHQRRIFLHMGQRFPHQFPVLENFILHPPCKTSRVR